VKVSRIGLDLRIRTPPHTGEMVRLRFADQRADLVGQREPWPQPGLVPGAHIGGSRMQLGIDITAPMSGSTLR